MKEYVVEYFVPGTVPAIHSKQRIFAYSPQQARQQINEQYGKSCAFGKIEEV